MKNKNGFTLVELLAVIVILSILIVIAVPNALSMSSKVKEKAYLTKIENIENAAKLYGENHINGVKNSNCAVFDIGNNKNIKKVTKQNYKSCDSSKNEYPTLEVTIQDLADSNNLSYDNTNQIGKLITDPSKFPEYNFYKQYYNNVVVNPINDNVINLCKVYIYYKYNNIYAWFDKNTCESKPIYKRLLNNGDVKENNAGYEYSSDAKLFKNVK